MDKQKDFTLAGFTGLIFILIGFIGFIIIAASFDYAEYNDIKEYSATNADEIAYMKSDLQTVWIVGVATLIVNVAIGVVLLTLGKIVRTLEEIRDSKKAGA